MSYFNLLIGNGLLLHLEYFKLRITALVRYFSPDFMEFARRVFSPVWAYYY